MGLRGAARRFGAHLVEDVGRLFDGCQLVCPGRTVGISYLEPDGSSLGGVFPDESEDAHGRAFNRVVLPHRVGFSWAVGVTIGLDRQVAINNEVKLMGLLVVMGPPR